ncbi:CAP domain-containing protein [Hyphomonas johnsonii]|nr:CAP domain-containing protein [Hyphomonas johnsonii]
MLHSCYKYVSLSALAFAALATPALASTSGCDLSDGLSLEPLAYAQEADACFEGLNGVDYDTRLERQIQDATNATRAAAGESHLEYQVSLVQAARIHAMDMAVRHYAAHEDLEGRDHLDRVRTFDRAILIGASGANIVVVDSAMDADAIMAALRKDPANAANMTREAFTDSAVGIARANGKTYVVQLFARVDGRLETPLPLVISGTENIRATFADNRLQPVGWRLTTASGDTVARGLGTRMTDPLKSGEQAYLTLDVAYRASEYALRGPLVIGR